MAELAIAPFNRQIVVRAWCAFALLLIATLGFPGPESSAASKTAKAKEILRKVDDLMRGASSYARLSMQIKTKYYSRTIRMEAWSKGKAKTLVRILAPLKEKGTATLKSANNIYSYLPRTDRTIRLTSGMMSGSWMGSHFTNDDLIKESRLDEDYDPTITFQGLRNDQQVLEFTLWPKVDAAVVWGKLILLVTADSYLPVQQTYFDEDMQVARTILYSEVKKLGGKLIPTVMRVQPVDKPEEFTELRYEILEFNLKIRDGFFSLANLQRR